MKRKLSVLVIIIIIVAMSIAVITVLAARKSFDTVIDGDLNTPYVGTENEVIQTVDANQSLKMFDGRTFVLYLKEGILTKLQADDRAACIDDPEAAQEDNPITGVVQIEKERGKGEKYLFRFKWDESTKKLVSDSCTGVFENPDGTITVTFTAAPFTLNVLLVETHPHSHKDHCYWREIWDGNLTFTVTLEEQL